MSCTVLLPGRGGRHDRRRRPRRIRRGECAAARPGAVQEEGNSNVAKAIPAPYCGAGEVGATFVEPGRRRRPRSPGGRFFSGCLAAMGASFHAAVSLPTESTAVTR